MSSYTLIANGRRVRLLAVMTDLTYTSFPDGNDRNVSIDAARAEVYVEGEPVPINTILHCPACGLQHIDAPEKREVDECPATGQGCQIGAFGPNGEMHCQHCGSPPHWTNPPHRSHLCHGCGHIWRPSDVPTNGVAEIQTKGKHDSPSPEDQPMTEEQGYAIEAIWQFVPELKAREDNLIVLTPAQLETTLRRLGWRAPCDARKGRV